MVEAVVVHDEGMARNDNDKFAKELVGNAILS